MNPCGSASLRKLNLRVILNPCMHYVHCEAVVLLGRCCRNVMCKHCFIYTVCAFILYTQHASLVIYHGFNHHNFASIYYTARKWLMLITGPTFIMKFLGILGRETIIMIAQPGTHNACKILVCLYLICHAFISMPSFYTHLLVLQTLAYE